MAVTQEFKQAVLQNNNLKTKIMLKDSLLVDTSFNQFDEMLRYAESKLMEFWVKDEEDDEILSDVLAVIEEYGADIPVFVAGGVFDGKDMAHYVNEGAAGVQIATRFIATNECDASDTFKQAIVNAKREDIRIIKSPVGMPARAINSPLLERLDAGETFTARKCNGCLTACKKDDSIPYCISRALIAAVKGDWDNGLFFAGSNADRVDRIMSVQELINEIMTDYRLNKSDIKAVIEQI
mgnify:CR=1 FL=1